MHSETDKDFKMNSHHVPLRQSVEEITLGKEQEDEGLDESGKRERKVLKTV